MQIRSCRGTQHRHVMVTHGHHCSDIRPESDIGACSLWPNNSDAVSSSASSTSIWQLLEGVREKLVLVQKDRGYMKELAKKEALLQGRKTSNNLDWYDYSGCRKKYV